MPIYKFDFQSDGRKLTTSTFDALQPNGVPEPKPAIPQTLKVEQKRDDIWFENQNINKSMQVHDILPQGYKTLDRGLKNYFSGMRVPTLDGVKLMGCRVSGADKPYMVWAQDLKRGRVVLPVMAIKRDGDEIFIEKFSPAHHHYFSKRFIDTDKTMIALTYRPLACKVNYTISIWGEFKRDLEYIIYQIRSRFNPLAEFRVEDEYNRMSLICHYNGMTTAFDDEVPADQRGNKRYDISIMMEGYLPLPEKIVPAILGNVTTLEDGSALHYGEVFDTVQGKMNYLLSKP